MRQTQALQRDPEVPRRIPNFPQPPDTDYVPYHSDEDIVSNPSDELNHDLDAISPAPQPAGGSGTFGRPLPPLPHSRNQSIQYSEIHSRNASEHIDYQGHQVTLSTSSNSGLFNRRDSLNPNAKPFVFGPRPGTSLPPSVTQQLHTSSLEQPTL